MFSKDDIIADIHNVINQIKSKTISIKKAIH